MTNLTSHPKQLSVPSGPLREELEGDEKYMFLTPGILAVEWDDCHLALSAVE